MNGIRQKLQVGMSNAQAHLLAEHLDANGDGQLTFAEFHEKINFKFLKTKEARYKISLKTFTDKVMIEWYQLRQAEKDKVQTFVEGFDDSEDRVIQFGEFK